MGRYINWKEGEGSGDKKRLAELLGATEITQKEAHDLSMNAASGILVWVDNGWMDALAWAYDYREFQAMTFPNDRRPKAFFSIDRAVAEARATD